MVGVATRADEADGDDGANRQLLLGMAATFAGLTVLLVMVALVFREPLVFIIALPFAASTYLFWYQATGRLAVRVRREAREHWRRQQRERERARGPRDGFGAGPREEWEPPGSGPGGPDAGRRRTRASGRRRPGQRRAPGVDPGRTAGPSVAESYRILGVDEGADEEAVRRAYRERVKEVHPDRGGDEDEFKRVTAAYERLTD